MKKIFVRFGELPEGCISKNHLTGKNENGLSVYEAIEEEGSVKILFPKLTYSACVSLSGVIDREAYEVAGVVIGEGSDGEPLLSDVKIIKRLTKRMPDADSLFI